MRPAVRLPRMLLRRVETSSPPKSFHPTAILFKANMDDSLSSDEFDELADLGHPLTNYRPPNLVDGDTNNHNNNNNNHSNSYNNNDNSNNEDNRPSKRAKLSSTSALLNRPISPPPLRRRPTTATPKSTPPNPPPPPTSPQSKPTRTTTKRTTKRTLLIPSPFNQTHIPTLPASKNHNTIKLPHLLRPSTLTKLYSFNFMHDLDFLLPHLPASSTPSIYIIHGDWRKDSPSRIHLESQKQKYQTQGYDITLIPAFLKSPTGTHHTKMMITFHDDDTAQVIIHTANMIVKDWESMTQAVWKSPLLHLLPKDKDGRGGEGERKEGTGWNFKKSLLAYLAGYEHRLVKLVEELKGYDFGNVRAVFVGSWPGEHGVNGDEAGLVGWSKAKRVLMRVGRGGGWGVSKVGGCVEKVGGSGEFVMQCSSVATLGAQYMNTTLLPAFTTSRPTGIPNAFTALKSPSSTSLSKSTSSSSSSTSSGLNLAKVNMNSTNISLVFPTAENVRTSITGWIGGSSIFLKSRTEAHKTQLEYLKPMMAVWGRPRVGILDDEVLVEAERGKVLPHIKTYNYFSPPKRVVPNGTSSLSYTDKKTNTTNDDNDGDDANVVKKEEDEDGEEFEREVVAMDWAMITSANLSKQAWGTPVKDKVGTIKVDSYEVGVLVHPGLWKDLLNDAGGSVTMEAVGGRNWVKGDGERMPDDEMDDDSTTTTTTTDSDEEEEGGVRREGDDGEEKGWDDVRVALRLAYDYPLKRYGENDEAWCQDQNYEGQDWTGAIYSDS
ncbi:hypothetical protein AA313_de0205394 [Arthrobotrys entomopaga]|nr:hypothetical protein AA313_de0205394 [Arthrobotrys entomopaga]